MRILVLCLLAAGCAHAPSRPDDAHTIVLSLQGLDCFECAAQFMPQLAKEPGIYDAKFDKLRVEVTLSASASFEAERAIAAIEKAGFHATLGPGQGKYVPGAAYPEGADAKVSVGDGRDVADLRSLLAPGKVTVVDFFADWCGPCKEVDQHLARAVAARADLAVRKLNIVDWDSPLAKHYVAKLPSMPVQIVFSRDGKNVATISGLDLAALDRAIELAGR